MIKKLLPGLLILAVILIISKVGNHTHYGISEGFYRMETESSKPAAYIHFNLTDSNNAFVLGAENISFSFSGGVELDGDVNLVAKTGEKWVLEVVDNDTLKFLAGKSDADSLMFPDGAIFKYADMK